MTKNWLAAGAIALTAGFTATAVQAQTTTVPGEQVGLAVGAPLPEGVYGINTFLYRDTGAAPPGAGVDVGINVPILLWSTPWKPLGGRLELAVAPPTVFTFNRSRGGRDTSINVGTFVGGIWAFDLGNNIGVSYLAGAYLNEVNAGRGGGLAILSSNTYRQGVALSYTGDGWNITSNLTYNFYDTPGRFDGRNGIPGFLAAANPASLFPQDALNLDLTATKKFGKFEIGAIGYGTTQISANPIDGSREGYFALGGLIGYDFGAFTAQAYVATDVVNRARDFRGREVQKTEGWFRVIVPLYTPAVAAAPAPAPLMRKY